MGCLHQGQVHSCRAARETRGFQTLLTPWGITPRSWAVPQAVSRRLLPPPQPLSVPPEQGQSWDSLREGTQQAPLPQC